MTTESIASTYIALRELFPECSNAVQLMSAGIRNNIITEDEATELRRFIMSNIYLNKF